MFEISNWISNYSQILITFIFKIIVGLLMLIIGWKAIKILTNKFNSFSTKKKFDITLYSFLSTLIDVVLKCLLIIVTLSYIGINTASFIALFTSAGLAVGLALQGSLSNFAGGVIILLMRPFEIGDFIETNKYSGKVEKIRIFYTSLLTPDNKVILIPNGSLSNESITNYSTKELRRVDITFSVDYSCNIEHVKSVLSEVIERHDLILKDPKYFIGLKEHADSSLNFIVRVWVKNQDYYTVYFDLMEDVKNKFDSENIDIPYPHMDVKLKQ